MKLGHHSIGVVNFNGNHFSEIFYWPTFQRWLAQGWLPSTCENHQKDLQDDRHGLGGGFDDHHHHAALRHHLALLWLWGLVPTGAPHKPSPSSSPKCKMSLPPPYLIEGRVSLILAVPLRREGQLYKWLRHSLTHSKTPKNYPKTPKIKFLGRFRSTKLLLYFSQQKLTISSLTFHPMTWTPCEDQPIFVKWFWNVPQTGVHCIIQPLGEFWREKKTILRMSWDMGKLMCTLHCTLMQKQHKTYFQSDKSAFSYEDF